MYLLGQLEPRWRITAYYLIALWAFIVVAKVVNLLLSEGSLKDRLTFLGIAPVLSIETWNAARAARWTDFWWSVGWAAIVFPAIVAVYLWFPAAISRSSLPWAAQAYLSIVPLWLLTEAVGVANRLVFLPAGILIPSIHDEPWRSRSLAEFLGTALEPAGWRLVAAGHFQAAATQALPRGLPRLRRLGRAARVVSQSPLVGCFWEEPIRLYVSLLPAPGGWDCRGKTMAAPLPWLEAAVSLGRCYCARASGPE
jgi:hypothetical protein